MGRRYFFKIFFVCSVVFASSGTMYSIDVRVVCAFLKNYYNTYFELQKTSCIAEEETIDRSDYLAFRVKLRAYRDTEWDCYVAENSPMDYKLQREDETVMRVIDHTCEEFYCRHEKGNLLTVLRGEDREARVILGRALMRMLRFVYRSGVEEESAESKEESFESKLFKATFFLEQFPKIRGYVFILNKNEGIRRRDIGFAKFLDRLEGKGFSSFSSPDVRSLLSKGTPERPVEVKDVFEKIRYRAN